MALFCEDHRDRGERVAATMVSITGNRPYCDGCWAVAPWAAKAAGSMPVSEIGKATGAKSWLQKEGMMPSGHSRKRIEIDEERLRAMHAKGMHDGEIAKAFGCSVPTLFKRRKSLGLPANGRGKSRAGRLVRPAVTASRGNGFRKAKRAAARRASSNVSIAEAQALRRGKSNGRETLVSIRVELLDAMWEGLEPAEKAGVMNRIVDARA